MDFADAEMTSATFLEGDYFNPIWADLFDKKGKLLIPILVPGALTTGHKALIRIPWGIRTVKVSLTAPVYPAGADVIAQLYKGGEPGGGATGTAMYTAGARPRLLDATTTGSGALATADVAATLPLVEGDVVAFDVEQADLGPLSNLMGLVILEP
jgi:hypothetical protein